MRDLAKFVIFDLLVGGGFCTASLAQHTIMTEDFLCSLVEAQQR